MNKWCVYCKWYFHTERICGKAGSRHCADFVGENNGCEEWESEYGEYIDEKNRKTCGNCKCYNAETKGCKRNPSVEEWEENDYCSYWAEIER